MSNTIPTQSDNVVFAKCIERAQRSGVNISNLDDVIVFLGREIDRYWDKLIHLESRIEELHGELHVANKALHEATMGTVQETTLEAVKESTTSEIIKVLSEHGYNTITVNCYKDTDTESEV